MELRPLIPDDVPAAAQVASEALPLPGDDVIDERRAWLARRIGVMAATDPGGAWVAEEDGAIVGTALAIVRDGLWGLSLMSVLPDRHARGIGTRLLEAALDHAAGTRGQIILSSTDPRAMRLYARAEFDLRPAVAAAGILDRQALPRGLRSRASEDVEAAAALARPVRGGAYGPDDLALQLTRPGAELLLHPAGFVIHVEGAPRVLAATSDEAAADLLWSCFAGAPRGGTVQVDAITAGQDWAIRTALTARLVLSPDGPLFTRGELGPLRPWLPSGAIL